MELLTNAKLQKKLVTLIVNHQLFRKLKIGRCFADYVAHVAYLVLSGGTTLMPL